MPGEVPVVPPAFAGRRLLLLAVSFLAVAAVAAPNVPSAERPRVVVLTDYYKDPDDMQSMIRLLCYANEFELEGLLATSLADGLGTVHPEWIQEILKDYAKVYAKLRQHEAPGYPYPAAEDLARVVHGGARVQRKLVGRTGGFPVPYPVGAHDSRTCEPAENWLERGRESAAAEHIIRVVDRDDPRPVWVLVWGGAMDLAQAIAKVRRDRPPEEAARFLRKLRVFQNSWQDTGSVWIWDHVPELFFVLSIATKGGLNAEEPASLHNEAWVREHLLEDHGPLAARYPPANVTGKTAPVIKEGDSPTFLHLLGAGLSDPEQPEWGGWGGRRERFDPNRNSFVDTRDRHPTSTEPLREIQWTLGRWAEAISHDFAARLDWCVREAGAANHAPIARVGNDATRRVIERTVRAGESLAFDASASTDPDGNTLSFRWWQYEEPGTFRGKIALDGAATARVSFVAPEVSRPETVHLIVEVTDNGEPRLVAYRRVVLTFTPRAGSAGGR